MTQFIEFKAKNTKGGLSTISLSVDKIVAIERSLSDGAVLIAGAAFSVAPDEAIRLARAVAELK